MNRRQFFKTSAGAAAMLALRSRAYAFYQTKPIIPLFGTNLRGIGTIGVAAPDPNPAPVTGVTHYTMSIDQFQDPGVVPQLGPTTLRGFNPTRLLAGQNNRHLGGIIVAQSGHPIQLTFRNNLPPGMHIIPNDRTIMGAELPANRTCVHFHGGSVPWISDGGPYAYWDPAGNRGPSFLNNQVLNPGAAANEAEYYYPLGQSSRFGWYHDHVFGMTRMNAYAGIASALIIRDTFEGGLRNLGLPNFIEAGGNEIPIVIQDKIFVGPDIGAQDPTWASVSSATTPGSLWYPHKYEYERWEHEGDDVPPDPSVVPEMFGDTMLVNGTAFPKVTVYARRYRLRLLNACNARFLNLQLYIADSSRNGITLDPVTGNPTNKPAGCDPNSPGTPSVLQIGTEGGLLAYPARIRTDAPYNPNTMKGSLLMAPAERPDVIVDFSKYAGKSIILYNDAPAPFPFGESANDYFPGWDVAENPVNGITPGGYGPNTRVLMRFNVMPAPSTDPPFAITTSTNLQAGNAPLLIPAGLSVPPPGIPVRQLSLNETFDEFGRLIQMLGTLTPFDEGGFGRPYGSPPTETPMAGTTEIWEIFNTTGDVHPMHFHLVNVQVINRQPFAVQTLGMAAGGALFSSTPTGPEPDEMGWKETVKMYPGTVTRVIMQFDLANAAIRTAARAVIPVPSSPRTGGAEYVWHCHILEHEEHDMMRPLIVI